MYQISGKCKSSRNWQSTSGFTSLDVAVLLSWKLSIIRKQMRQHITLQFILVKIEDVPSPKLDSISIGLINQERMCAFYSRIVSNRMCLLQCQLQVNFCLTKIL